jgi:SAM-dependent methyltransferase
MNTAQSIQLKFKFYYDHVLSQVYSEGDSPYHVQITQDVVKRFIDPLDIDKSAKILDLGCGPGYFLKEMSDRGYTNVTGLTLSREDAQKCQSQGFRVELLDMNFLNERDESVDMLFCRHSLEHSPFPYITLLEYNRVLRPQGVLYIEVPQPDCDRLHETNPNHYSIMGRPMWLSLLQRTGFDVSWYDYELPVSTEDQSETYLEKYHMFVCRRRRPVDVK